MKNLLAFLAMLAAVAARAYPGPQINGGQINPQTGISIATFAVTGAGDTSIANSLTASSVTASGAGFKGAGTGLTGTAASLSIGGTASALTTAGSAASSGFVCRGVDASGNCLPAAVNATTSGVSSSTSPWSAGAAFTTDALNAKLAGATFTGASGITNQAFTATGANGNLVSASSVTTTGGLFGASLRVTGQASGTQCASFDGSGNLTGTGSICASTSGFGGLSSTQTWAGVNKFTSTNTVNDNFFIFQSTFPNGTAAPAHNTSAYTKVALNYSYANIEGVVTLQPAGTATLPAGTWLCTFGDCIQNTGSTYASRLRDTTNSVTLGVSKNCGSNAASQNIWCPGVAYFTNAAQIVIEIEARSLGPTTCSANSYGEPEVYTELSCTRKK